MSLLSLDPPVSLQVWHRSGWISTCVRIPSQPMGAVAFDVSAVRRRFSALDRPLAFFDGPGGTRYRIRSLKQSRATCGESNENVSGRARPAAGPRCSSTALAAPPARAPVAGRRRSCSARTLTTIRLRADANDRAGPAGRGRGRGHSARPRRQRRALAPAGPRSPDLVVRFADIRDDTSLDLDDLAAQLPERTRVVAYPWASNAARDALPTWHASRSSRTRRTRSPGWTRCTSRAPTGPSTSRRSARTC